MKLLFMGFISVYQTIVSPFLGPCCRFYPSCSAYAKEAIDTKGIWSGTICALKRLFSCHPFHPGGYDPLV